VTALTASYAPGMLTPLRPADLDGLAAGELATSLPPALWHDTVRSLGTHCRDGDWLVAGPDEVALALTSPALHVAPPPGTAGPAADLLAAMARFCDGARHQHRREVLTAMLPPVVTVAQVAADRAREYLADVRGAFDLMPLARSLPAAVLAAAMGLPSGRARRAAWLAGRLCDGVTPVLNARPRGRGEADDAAARLLDLLAAADLPGSAPVSDKAVAAASILFQARDATAGLIGLTMLASRQPGALTAAERVERVLRQDAPVQNTRRVAAARTTIGAADLPAGAPVWVFVATAERGAGVPATFGTGPHGCPGAGHAAAIAAELVAVLERQGWRAAGGQEIRFEPRPNVRIPQRLLVAPS
jgi:cytochrome P450